MKVAATHATGVGTLMLNEENATRVMRHNQCREGFIALTIEQAGEFYRVDLGRARRQNAKTGVAQ